MALTEEQIADIDMKRKIGEEFGNDPEAADFRKYRTKNEGKAEEAARTISNLISGASDVTFEEIEKCRAAMLTLNQIAHVYRTMPSGKTLGRQRVIEKMHALVKKAQENFEAVLSWADHASITDAIDRMEKSFQVDEMMSALPPELQTAEARQALEPHRSYRDRNNHA